jgi:hypothetical protein
LYDIIPKGDVMNIHIATQSYQSFDIKSQKSDIKEDQKLTSGKQITETYLKEYMSESLKFASKSISEQSEKYKFTLSDIGYTGKPISELSQEEAKELVSEDGFFGITQTSTRIAEFIINGAGDDLEKLKAGREGMLQGFADAENTWGSKLPEISQETMKKAVEMVDDRIKELGGQVLDITS